MRHPAFEKLESLRRAEGPQPSEKPSLEVLSILRTTRDCGHARNLSLGMTGLEDRRSSPAWVRNRLPDKVRDEIFGLALDEPELLRRELAERFPDTERVLAKEGRLHKRGTTRLEGGLTAREQRTIEYLGPWAPRGFEQASRNGGK